MQKQKKKWFLESLLGRWRKKGQAEWIIHRLGPVQFVSYIGNAGKVSFEQKFHGWKNKCSIKRHQVVYDKSQARR